MPMNNCIILRGVGGFYDVLAEDDLVYRCKLRGRLRLSDEGILVGDYVEMSPLGGSEGIIEEVLPRKNRLARPAIANIDQAIIVMACDQPQPNMPLLDRLLVLIAAEGIEPVICFNKTDLVDVFPTSELYRDIGYQVVTTSSINSEGIEQLREFLRERISTFTGPSGVGKSSLLNQIEPGMELAVGSISDKLKRGKHTTRQVELLRLSGGGLVADTPGFSQLTLNLAAQDLGDYFLEMAAIAHECYFGGCMHNKEPKCAVINQVEQGIICASRYENYLMFLAEAQQQRKYD